MTRGNTQEAKMHYKGEADDFVVYIDSPEAVRRWKKDSSVPLVEVLNGYFVFVTHKYGSIVVSHAEIRV
jgi:hypothetical protein